MKEHLQNRLSHLRGNLELLKEVHKDLDTTEGLKYQIESEMIIRNEQIKGTLKRIEEIPTTESNTISQ